VERRSVKVKLEQPIEANGTEIAELTIIKPAGREFEAMDRGKGEVQRTNHLLAACAKVPYSTILNLSPEDYEAAMGALGGLGFPEASQPSSESSEEFLETGPTRSE